MVKCMDCIFWEKPRPRETTDFGECTLAESNDGFPEHHESLAYASDMESYQARLNTRPHYGCVQGRQHPHIIDGQKS